MHRPVSPRRPVTLADGLAYRLALADFAARHSGQDVGAAAIWAGASWPLFLTEAAAELERFRAGLPCDSAAYLRLLLTQADTGLPCPAPSA